MRTEWLGAVCGMWIVLWAIPGYAEEAAPFPRALMRSAVCLGELDEAINDALILGNGDVNGLLFAEGDDLVFRVTKNDVWDARLDTDLDPPLPTLARLKALGKGEWPDRNWILPAGSAWHGPDSYNAHAYPCPRACAVVRIKGAAAALLAARLDIGEGVASVFAAETQTEVFAATDANAFVFTTKPMREVVLDPVISGDLPAPETGKNADAAWVKQSIPGDHDWPGMQFVVACRSTKGRSVVSVATSYESPEPLEAALRAAQAVLERPAGDVEQKRLDAWRSFWAQSGVELADATLERTWYRNLYFLRCVSAPGVVSTGLFAGLLDDKPAWHGDYHTNYNIQQTYWGAFSANHLELVEPYDRLIAQYLPRARWLARTIFDCGGAYFPHVLYAYEPFDPAQCKSPNGRQYIHHVWAFTMGVSAFTVQPLWWHYKYAPDRGYLEQVAYPAVRDVAEFYADFVGKCDRVDGHIVLSPTVSPEHHGWTAGFERNRDGTFCIAYFHFAFDAAIEGAEALERDADLVARWKEAKALLPDYPLSKQGAPGIEPLVVDVAGAAPLEYNIPVPATPVFPADQVTLDSPEPVRDLFGRTIAQLKHNGNNAPIMLAVARARLGLPGACDWLRTEIDRRERRNGTLSFNRLEPRFDFNRFGHYTEMFGAVLPITELLVQSVNGVVRVFPAWPAWLPARFERLRAEGGFLVSAEHDEKDIRAVRIESTAGGLLCMAPPFRSSEVQAGGGEWAPAVLGEDGKLRIHTAAGQVYEFRAAAR